MDLLIEIIVGLLKALFGESEKPADPSQFSRKQGGQRGARGPYNYGGGNRPAAPPKTLEEILEEVRRQASDKRANAGPPAPRAAPTAPKPSGAAPARQSERIEDRGFAGSIKQLSPVEQVESKIEKRERESVATVADSGNKTDPGLLVHLKPLEHVISENKEAAPLREKVQQISPAQAAAELAATKNRKKIRTATPPAAATTNVLQAIQSGSPAERREAARQAMILQEVFGPPRAYRPIRRRADYRG